MAFNHQAYNAIYLESAHAGDPPPNDAEKYEVEIEAAAVDVGEKYWKVIGVHHLKPNENWGNHHVYLEALDEDGNRVLNPIVWVGWTWDGRRPNESAPPVPVDKPDTEPGGNIAIGKNQIVSVWINGRKPDASDKSDRVVGIRTTHPDEPLPDGTLHNTWGHHSFYVVFQETVKSGKAKNKAKSVIFGRVIGGKGQTVRLLRQNNPIAAATLDASETFRFENLAAGSYTLLVQGTGIRRGNLEVDGKNGLEVNLAMPAPEESVIHGVVANGMGHTIILGKGGVVIARQTLPPDGKYEFANLPRGVYDLAIWDTNIKVANIDVDGHNTRTVNLEIPEEEPKTDKSIPHYVLLGPPQSRARRLTYFVAMDFVLHFSLEVGFSVETARLARRVTAMGDGITTDTLEALRQSGSEVEHLTGNPSEIESILTQRIQNEQAFG